MTSSREPLIPPAGGPGQRQAAEDVARRILDFPTRSQLGAYAAFVVAYRQSLYEEYPDAAREVLNQMVENFGDAVLAVLGELDVTLTDVAGSA